MFLAKTKKSEIPVFIGYILLLHISNAIFDLIVRSYAMHHINNLYLQALVEPLWKIVFWIMPTILYIVIVDQRNPFVYLKLTNNIGKGLLWVLGASILFILGVSYQHFLRGMPINLNLGFDTWLNMIALVGFFEEIPFRGLVFQKLNEFLGFWQASLIGSFLFVCLHIPYWISIDKPLAYYPYNALYIFVFAFIMCFVLKRSGSLWSCIIIHGMNDLVSLIV